MCTPQWCISEYQYEHQIEKKKKGRGNQRQAFDHHICPNLPFCVKYFISSVAMNIGNKHPSNIIVILKKYKTPQYPNIINSEDTGLFLCIMGGSCTHHQ